MNRTSSRRARVGALLLSSLALASCNIELYAEDKAAEHLNSSIGGDYTLDDPTTDDSVELSGCDSGSTRGKVTPGMAIAVSMPFSAPNGNVTGVGIRFGANGPVTVLNQNTGGMTGGMLSGSFMVTPDVCANLSQVCHDIKCYEVAVTDAGQISRANIMDVALACGNCDEPSCQDLLDECVVPAACQDIVDSIASSGNSCIDRCVSNLLQCLIDADCVFDQGCVNSYSSCTSGCTGGA